MNTLIVGGTSGLGYALGEEWSARGSTVYVTGRRPPDKFKFLYLSIEAEVARLIVDLENLVERLPHIDLLIYSAGFAEDGRIDELKVEHILTMQNVGLLAPALLLKYLIKKQAGLEGFIAITSTSQWRPREMEPMYCATKAGLAHLANCVSLDVRVEKTLVVGPTGMQTNLWTGTDKDVMGMLPPKVVAREIVSLWSAPYRYRLARILREPLRVEVLETRT